MPLVTWQLGQCLVAISAECSRWYGRGIRQSLSRWGFSHVGGLMAPLGSMVAPRKKAYRVQSSACRTSGMHGIARFTEHPIRALIHWQLLFFYSNKIVLSVIEPFAGLTATMAPPKKCRMIPFYNILNYSSLMVIRQYSTATGGHGVFLGSYHVTKHERMIPFPISWERLFFSGNKRYAQKASAVPVFPQPAWHQKNAG